jgi:hypothetical protein
MGERIGRIGRIRTDFWDSNARILSKKIKKNPFVSAGSAQSVFPSYHKTTQRGLSMIANAAKRTQ